MSRSFSGWRMADLWPCRNPDFVALTPCRVIVGAEDDSWSVVEPLLIVSIDSMPKKSSARNGGGKKKRPPKS